MAVLNIPCRRLLGTVLAVQLAVATVGVGSANASVGASPSNNLIAQYDFTAKPADGKSVPNSAPDAKLGESRVEQAHDSLWQDKALTFVGGPKNGEGDWVRLPDNLLQGAHSSTISIEVKADAAMQKDFHFLWNMGNEGNNSGTGPYWFTSLKCADGRTPLTWVKDGPKGSEHGASADSCSASYDQWLSVTSVIDGDSKTARLYINGVQVASGPVTITPAQITDQTYNVIGRSPWPDNLFKGSVSMFRVYNAALSNQQISEINVSDAVAHAHEITSAVLDDIAISNEVNDGYISLPTANGAVTWKSSDPDVIAPDGTVNQPASGQEASSVTLTATAAVRGQSASKQFEVTVNPTTKTDRELLNEALQSYVIPPVLRSGDSLPSTAAGITSTVTSCTGVRVQNGQIFNDGTQFAQGTVTVSIKKKGIEGSGEKTFHIKVLPASDSAVIGAYDRNATSVDDANNGDIAYSMHLALQGEDGVYTPYNQNYGIFFPRLYKALPMMEVTQDWARNLRDPSIFYLSDGSFAVVAVRTKRGNATADARNSILVARSRDLLSYDEKENSGSIIDLGETNGVHNPRVVWDSSSGKYVVAWKDDNGLAKTTTFDDVEGSQSRHGEVLTGTVPMTGAMTQNVVKGIDNFRSGTTLAVEKSIIDKLNVRFGRIRNTSAETSVKQVAVHQYATKEEVRKTLGAISEAELNYSDGSKSSLPISSWDISHVNTSMVNDSGYDAVGKIKQTKYQIPLAEDRADPTVQKWVWKHPGKDGETITETKYLMIATNDINGDCTWQRNSPHMPFRMADSIAGLADTPGDPSGLINPKTGYNPKESVLLEKGDLDADGNAMMHSFWAPEIHTIDGRLTILFMAGYGKVWSNGHAVYMRLKQDADGYDLDPTKAENWEKPVTILRQDGKPLATTASGKVGMSLDMTYFEAHGQSYYVWQQLGATYIAKVDPAKPARLTSMPVRIVTPEYAWNVTIAEGPNVVIRDGKAYLIFSGSAVGKTYTTGLAVADAAGDLTKPDNWTVLNYPIQKSGMFNGKMQLGTGHGMWSEDEDGIPLYVFHAYADKTEGFSNTSGRDTFIRRVHWASDGYPKFDMSEDEELKSDNVTVKVRVIGKDTPLPDDASLQSLTIAGKIVDLDAAKSAEGAKLEVDDPSQVEVGQVKAVTNNPHARQSVSIHDARVTVNVTAEDKTTTQVYRVLLVGRGAPPTPAHGANDVMANSGTAVSGAAMGVVLFALLGIGLTLWRKRRQ